MQVQGKSIKLAVHLTENPVAFQGKCGYNVMGAEKNKRRESGICFFKPINEQPVCEADSRARRKDTPCIK